MPNGLVVLVSILIIAGNMTVIPLAHAEDNEILAEEPNPEESQETDSEKETDEEGTDLEEVDPEEGTSDLEEEEAADLEAESEEIDDEADADEEIDGDETGDDTEELDEAKLALFFDETSYALELKIEGSISFEPEEDYLSTFSVDYLLYLQSVVPSLQKKQTLEAEAQIETTVVGILYNQGIVCNLIPNVGNVTSTLVISPRSPDEGTGGRRIHVVIQGLEAISENWESECIITPDYSFITMGEEEKPFAELLKAAEPSLTSFIATESAGMFTQEFDMERTDEEDPVYFSTGTARGEMILSPQ